MGVYLNNKLIIKSIGTINKDTKTRAIVNPRIKSIDLT